MRCAMASRVDEGRRRTPKAKVRRSRVDWLLKWQCLRNELRVASCNWLASTSTNVARLDSLSNQLPYSGFILLAHRFKSKLQRSGALSASASDSSLSRKTVFSSDYASLSGELISFRRSPSFFLFQILRADLLRHCLPARTQCATRTICRRAHIHSELSLQITV